MRLEVFEPNIIFPSSGNNPFLTSQGEPLSKLHNRLNISPLPQLTSMFSYYSPNWSTKTFPPSCLKSTKSQSKLIVLFDPKTKSCLCEQWFYLLTPIITRNSFAVLPLNPLQDTSRGINAAVETIFSETIRPESKRFHSGPNKKTDFGFFVSTV